MTKQSQVKKKWSSGQTVGVLHSVEMFEAGNFCHVVTKLDLIILDLL